MKIAQLLKAASRRKDVDEVASQLIEGLDTTVFKDWMIRMEEAYMERPNQPHIRVEASRLLSPEYALSCLFELRDGAFTAYAELIQFDDKQGLNSRHWRRVEESEVCPLDSESLKQHCLRIKHALLGHHTGLLASVGISGSIAATAVKKMW